MNNDRWSEVDALLATALLRPEPALADALAASAAAGLPAMHVSPLQGALLRMLVAQTGGRRVLEVGTLAGYSTLWLAGGLAPDGALITLEIDPAHAAVARETIARAGMAGRIELRLGAAAAALETLLHEGGAPFDFVFIDADKRNNLLYFRYALALARPGALIVVDNVVRGGAIADPAADDASLCGVRALLAALRDDPTLTGRVTATAIQTVGEKGYDGLLIAHVTQEVAHD